MRNMGRTKKAIDLAAKAVIAGDTVHVVSLKNSQLYQDYLQQRVKELMLSEDHPLKSDPQVKQKPE